jgi:hypothetical protein
MTVDNYPEAMALTKKLNASLPIKVKAGKEFLKMLKKPQKIANPEQEFEIDSVSYAGDEGGIMCGLVSTTDNPKDKEKYIVSLTHLKIDPDHPHLAEVQAYQNQRIRNLMQNEGNFGVNLMTLKPAKRKKSGKGFGK